MSLFLESLESFRPRPDTLGKIGRLEHLRGYFSALEEVGGVLLELPEPSGPVRPKKRPRDARRRLDHLFWLLANQPPTPEPREWIQAGVDAELFEVQATKRDPLVEIFDGCSWELEFQRRPPVLVLSAAMASCLTLEAFPRGEEDFLGLFSSFFLIRGGYPSLAWIDLPSILEDHFLRSRSFRHRLRTMAEGPVLEEWTGRFLGWIEHALESARPMLEVRQGSTRLSRLQQDLVDLIRREGRTTSRRAAEITGASRNTLKDNFRRLVDSGVLARHGQRRGVFYTLTPGGLVDAEKTSDATGASA